MDTEGVVIEESSVVPKPQWKQKQTEAMHNRKTTLGYLKTVLPYSTPPPSPAPVLSQLERCFQKIAKVFSQVWSHSFTDSSGPLSSVKITILPQYREVDALSLHSDQRSDHLCQEQG